MPASQPGHAELALAGPAIAARRRVTARRSAGGPLGRMMFHHGVRGGREHAVVTVRPPDQVRRRSALPVDLDDHTLAVLIANMAAPDHDLIAHFSVHPDLLLLNRRYAASGLRARWRRSRARSSPSRPPQIPCLIEFRSA